MKAFKFDKTNRNKLKKIYFSEWHPNRDAFRDIKKMLSAIWRC